MNYLLDVQMEANVLFAIALASLAITLTIFYFLIKGAVSKANKELLEQQKAANALKVLEMKKEGFDPVAVSNAGGYYTQVQSIEKRKQYMINEDYIKEKKRLQNIYQD